MSKKFLCMLTVAVGMVAMVLPASANNMSGEIFMDCEGFSGSVAGRVGGSVGDQVIIVYSFTLASGGQIVETVTGTITDLPAPSGHFYDFARNIQGSWSGELCGDYTVSGLVALVNSVTMQPLVPSPGEETILDFYAELNCPCDGGPGTGTPGYWMNHPEAWPVWEITIGCVTYSKEDAIAIMQTPPAGDKTYSVFFQLIAAKLNVIIGNEASCIAETITAADEWLCAYPVGSGVAAGGPDSPWRVAKPLHEMLDDYNNGDLCAPHRDS